MADAAPTPAAPALADLKSVHTTSLVELLTQASGSFLVSTYQAGKVIVVRVENGTINTHFRTFQVPMGMAVQGGRLAVGTKVEVIEYHNQPQAAAQLEKKGHDAVFLARHSVVTGHIAIHDIAWAGKELWAVNTRFSCLCTLDPLYSFVPRWRPKFITGLSSDDRCHLNGLGLRDGKPKYVTALGETDTAAGWRANKATGGCIIDVETNEFISRGLSMPHSPRWHDGKLWVLESGVGSLSTVDLATGKLTHIALLPGFTRGLDFIGPFALVGLSQVRESALFSGLPITDRLPVEERKCGVWVVDTRSGEVVAFLRFDAGVQEIFAVQSLPGMKFPEIVEMTDDVTANIILLPDEHLKDVAAAPKG